MFQTEGSRKTKQERRAESVQKQMKATERHSLRETFSQDGEHEKFCWEDGLKTEDIEEYNDAGFYQHVTEYRDGGIRHAIDISIDKGLAGRAIVSSSSQ